MPTKKTTAKKSPARKTAMTEDRVKSIVRAMLVPGMGVTFSSIPKSGGMMISAPPSGGQIQQRDYAAEDRAWFRGYYWGMAAGAVLLAAGYISAGWVI